VTGALRPEERLDQASWDHGEVDIVAPCEEDPSFLLTSCRYGFDEREPGHTHLAELSGRAQIALRLRRDDDDIQIGPPIRRMGHTRPRPDDECSTDIGAGGRPGDKVLIKLLHGRLLRARGVSLASSCLMHSLHEEQPSSGMPRIGAIWPSPFGPFGPAPDLRWTVCFKEVKREPRTHPGTTGTEAPPCRLPLTRGLGGWGHALGATRRRSVLRGPTSIRQKRSRPHSSAPGSHGRRRHASR
jgi:hypothetical protein